MQIKPLSMHTNVFAYLRYEYPQIADNIADVPVVELETTEWEEDATLTGDGVLVVQDVIDNIADQISRYSQEQLERYRSIYREMNRDIYIYELYQKIGRAPFIIVRQGHEASIVHEASHLIWRLFSEEKQSSFELPEVTPPDSDSYIESPTERFAYMSEMKYFKSQGMSFDDFFRTYNPREWELIHNPRYDGSRNQELAKLDYIDYINIWDQIKMSSSIKNWLTKIAQSSVVLHEGIHTGTKRPIYYLTGQTYPIRDKLGRHGLGFNWYGAKKIWWMYKDRMNDRIIKELQRLGVDTSILRDSTSSDVSSNDTNSSNVTETSRTDSVSSGLTNRDLSDDPDLVKKSKWYGFPINQNIYLTTVPVEINGQQLELTVKLHRGFKKGRRGIPSYIYDIFWNDKLVGRLGKPAPSKWGTYNEDEIAQEIPDFVQKSLANGPKSKTYNNIVYMMTVAGRDPTLVNRLKQLYSKFDENGMLKKDHVPQVQILITAPKYEGKYPAYLSTYDGESFYLETALDHPQAPNPDTLFYFGAMPPEVHTMEQFNTWIQQELRENMEQIQERYLKYLQSFPFLPEEQKEAAAQFQEILPIIEGHLIDVNFFRQKLLERGYIRPSRRRRRQVPGMQLQDDVELLLDSKKIVEDAYDLKKLSHSPEFFYTVIAYLMHRQKAGNIGFGAAFGQIGMTMQDFYSTLKRHGADIDFGEMYDYIEDLSKILLRDLIGVQAKGSAWDQYEQFYSGFGSSKSQDSTIPGNIGGLDSFVQFAVTHGLNESEVRNNPIKAYRELAIRFHPDRNPNNPEAEDLFKQLGTIWETVPESLRKRSMSWLYRICIACK